PHSCSLSPAYRGQWQRCWRGSRCAAGCHRHEQKNDATAETAKGTAASLDLVFHRPGRRRRSADLAVFEEHPPAAAEAGRDLLRKANLDRYAMDDDFFAVPRRSNDDAAARVEVSGNRDPIAKH